MGVISAKEIMTIKVNLSSGSHSEGRGVGFYAQFLSESLKKEKGIELTDKNPDLIHYPFFDLFYPTLPFKKIVPTVVTIHDLTPLVLSSLYPRGVKSSINLLRQWLSLQSVSAVITDSVNSKQDLVKIFKLSPKKVFVTPLSVNPIYSQSPSSKKISAVKKKYSLPDKFVLNVSAGPNPNKNLPALAQATQDLNIPLIIAGGGVAKPAPSGKVHPELKDLAELKKYSHVITPGFVPNEDLLVFYKLASLYCQPSLYEGFGLPVLEAMNAGCLVVSSHVSSLPEIYSRNTITFSPRDLEGMKQALNHALHLTAKKKAALIKEAKKKADDFDWKKTAQATIKIYRSVLGK